MWTTFIERINITRDGQMRGKYFLDPPKILSTFKRSIKPELFDIASYCKREHSA